MGDSVRVLKPSNNSTDAWYLPDSGEISLPWVPGGTTLILCDAECDLPAINEGLELYYDWLTNTDEGKNVHPSHLNTVNMLIDALAEGQWPH